VRRRPPADAIADRGTIGRDGSPMTQRQAEAELRTLRQNSIIDATVIY
jgi:hypothetical protein